MCMGLAAWGVQSWSVRPVRMGIFWLQITAVTPASLSMASIARAATPHSAPPAKVDSF